MSGEKAQDEESRKGSGSIIEGDIHTEGGDFVGRDKIIITDQQAYNVSGLPNPYLGLRSFTYEDRWAYSGRTTEVADTVARLTAPEAKQVLMFVTGASGSGKSSFAQAGLLPALEKHYRKRHKIVRRAVFRPGTQPLAALADSLTQLELPEINSEMVAGWRADGLALFLGENTPKNQVNLLVVDQFEEFFSQSPPDQRQQVFDLLAALPAFTHINTLIIATMRSDYLDDLFAHQTVWEMTKSDVELRAMTVEDLKLAIQGPLEAAGQADERYRQKRFEPALLGQLAEDATQEAAYLPLLQVCLGELWSGGSLALGRYEGLAIAIQERAEAVYAFCDYDAARPMKERTPEEKQAIMAIMLDLVSVSLVEGTKRNVRRRRFKGELETEPDRTQLLDDLVVARLLSVSSEAGNEMVEIIHEALIDNWDRFRTAITDFRERLRKRARFEMALTEWLAQDRADEYLLVGIRLAEARALNDVEDVALGGAVAKDFLHHSLMQAEAEQQRELAQAKSLATTQRQRTIVLAIGLALTIALSLVSLLLYGQSQQYLSDVAEQAGTATNALGISEQRGTEVAHQAATVTNALGLSQQRGTEVVAQKATSEANAAEAQQQAQIANAGELAAVALTKREGELDLALLLGVEAFKTEDMLQTQVALYQAWAHNPKLERFLQGHTNLINSVAWSRDGRLASGSYSGRVIVWDMESGEVDQILEGHVSSVSSVAWSKDGRLASGGGTGHVIVWDLENSEPAKDLKGHTGDVNSVAWSEDGRLASGDSDGRVIVWDFESGEVAQVLEGHEDDVTSVAWSSDGRLASGSWDRHVIVWDLANSKPVQILNRHMDNVTSVAWSRDGRLASGSYDNRVIVWDPESGNATQILEVHTISVESVAWSRDGQLASGGGDGRTIVWDLGSGIPAQVLEGQTDYVRSVAWSGDGRLASGSDDGRAIVWDLESEVPSIILEGQGGSVNSLAWSGDGWLASNGSTNVGDGHAIVWDLGSGTPAQILEGHTDIVESVAWSGNGRLASGSWDNQVIVWDLESEEPDQILEGHLDNGISVVSVAWSGDGRLASGSGDKRVIVWDLGSGEPAQILEGHSGWVTSVAWSEDGRLASSGGGAGQVIVWDLMSGIPAKILNEFGLNSVAWSRDGRLASGSGVGSTIVWDLMSGEAAQTLEGYLSSVSSVAWSGDGRLASGGVTNAGDGRVIVWDLDGGKVTQILEGHTYGVDSVAWSGDGRLASGSVDGIRVWQLNPVIWLQEACQRAGRNLTEEEWNSYLYWKPYDPEYRTCPQWPPGGSSLSE